MPKIDAIRTITIRKLLNRASKVNDEKKCSKMLILLRHSDTTISSLKKRMPKPKLQNVIRFQVKKTLFRQFPAQQHMNNK